MSKATPLKLVVGLGNPGPEYERTRHNAGFWFVDELARMLRASFRPDSKYAGELAQAAVGGQVLWLLKPMAYMNRSGQSVARLANFYKIPPEAILVAHDELDLAPGTVRVKRGGGHGGHNGLRDIIAQLGNPGFLRLRLGIGHPGHASQVVDFVLRKAPQSEQALIEQALDAAVREFERLACGEVDKVMHTLHSRG